MLHVIILSVDGSDLFWWFLPDRQVALVFNLFPVGCGRVV